MLTKILSTTRNCFFGLAIASVSLFFPVASYAETATGAEPCTPPSAAQPGVNVPTGSEAVMFHYDCERNLWVSDHYTYDPITHVTSPVDPVVYTYNDATGQWDVGVWTFVASKGTYLLMISSVPQPPAGATTVGSPKPIEPVAASTTTTSATVPAATNSTDATVNATATATNNTTAAINNNIGSLATTGGATVFGNTLAGNATTGNALAMANVINILQTSSSAFGPGGNGVTFVANINGNVNGDLLLDPALIGTVQPASSTLNGTLTVNSNNNTDAQINNNINLAAASGNATVGSNTTAGNATTGAAAAVANVVNFLNSAVSSGKSFLGVININGNLNGDILMPPNFIDQLIASNVPKVTINTDLSLTNNTNQAINNNVNATASSGTAIVDKNTTAGNATTGAASTNITAFNLTGSTVIGSNSLLVFVNVLGTWYGMIFNAPGVTSADLGGGITQATINSTVNATNNTNQAINNNINVGATSGNALVSKNTNAGNATSGNAQTAVNLLNVANSTMSLANWFGILFINVFGTWNGSFGINTSAGDLPATATATTSGDSAPVASPPSRLVFRFVAHTGNQPPNTVSSDTTNNSNPTFSPDDQGTVLAAHTTNKVANDKLPSVSQARANFWLPAFGIFLGASMLIGERVRSSRRG